MPEATWLISMALGYLSPAQMLSLVAFVTATVCAQDSSSIRLAPNQTLAHAGYDVSSIITPSAYGMGIEPSNLFSFTGGAEVNQMSVSLLGTLANYTGVAPRGNTQDYMYYDGSFNEFSVRANPLTQGRGVIPSDSLIIGPAYLQALDRFPAGTPITLGLNLAYQGADWAQRIIEFTNATLSMLEHVQLVSFELGNEPDLYANNGFRTGVWDGTTYTAQWLERAAQIYAEVLMPRNITPGFFEPACTASTIGTSFEIMDLAQAGILAPAVSGSIGNKSYVASFNQHDYYYYFNVSTYALDLNLFQNLQETRTQFNAWVGQIQQANALGVPYVLREMASVGPIGAQGISDTFGAALWTLDFFLYAATLNISSVQIHMTDNSFAAPWQPGQMHGRGPHVRPSYYAFAAIAQIIGATCTTRVQELPLTQIPTAYQNHLAAYSIFRGTSLTAVVVLNTRVSNSTTTLKDSVQVNLSLPSSANNDIFVSSLLGPGTDATFNTTWNGISYETPDWQPLVVGGDSAAQKYTLDDSGAMFMQLRDASAIVLQLDNAIGTGPSSIYDVYACQSLARSLPEPNSAIGPSSGEQSSNQADASALSSSIAAATATKAGGISPVPTTTRQPGAPNVATRSLEPSLLILMVVAAASGWSGLSN